MHPLGLLAARAALASVTVGDPSDVTPASDWADDNAIVPDYNVPFLEYQPSDSKYSLRLASRQQCVPPHSDMATQLNQAARRKQLWP